MNWIFGDNINTDLITPGRFNITTDPKEMAQIAFIEYRPEFTKQVSEGDFLIAGSNFGCGSSRETAAIALKYCGLKAIIAKSFARIFYRNCLNLGLLTIVADTDSIEAKDMLMLNTKKKWLKNTTKRTHQRLNIPMFVLRLAEAGGIIPFIKKNGIEALAQLEKFAQETYE